MLRSGVSAQTTTPCNSAKQQKIIGEQQRPKVVQNNEEVKFEGDLNLSQILQGKSTEGDENIDLRITKIKQGNDRNHTSLDKDIQPN